MRSPEGQPVSYGPEGPESHQFLDPDTSRVLRERLRHRLQVIEKLLLELGHQMMFGAIVGMKCQELLHQQRIQRQLEGMQRQVEWELIKVRIDQRLILSQRDPIQ